MLKLFLLITCAVACFHFNDPESSSLLISDVLYVMGWFFSVGAFVSLIFPSASSGSTRTGSGGSSGVFYGDGSGGGSDGGCGGDGGC
ncbi:hypothetical protein [Parendozoicomonas haliclonae]|uniref:Uncharacterized protein n=1 Tax=Parendozoicomonas haliclonae TaxID=1960125 RepID=A0A1X7AIK4_9GAMM|nr:hypothetical protein [Parendozoicomonas haliclonae]SMA45388.1 hypothetical protein EHSB41UT_01911 [Parendozoicomonas haliclonae]